MEMKSVDQHNYIASSVLMVRPVDFTYDPQTAEDNFFQRTPALEDVAEIRAAAVKEFNQVVQLLEKKGISVILADKAAGAPVTPSAVFPNNWFSTESDGRIVYYPMRSESRRLERQESHIEAILGEAGCTIRERLEVGETDGSAGILEGTGAMVIDRKNRIIYAALSKRCDIPLLEQFTDRLGYRQFVTFDTTDSQGHAIYHTNVMMAIGDTFAVVCADCITGDSYQREVKPLLGQDKDIIEISMDQMEQGFCGNILQLANANGDKFIVMSARARRAFTPDQIARLEQHGEILSTEIDIIETAGGGGIRCMLAEIFLPRQTA